MDNHLETKSNNSDNSFDLVGESAAGLNYVSTGRKKKKNKKKKDKGGIMGAGPTTSMGGSSRRESSRSPPPNSTGNFELQQFGSQYVLPPQPKPEEQISLVSSDNLDPDDPLAGHDNFQDEFEDDMDEIEMDKRQNFNSFSNKSDKRSNGGKKSMVKVVIPLLVGILFLLGLVAGILYLAGVGKSKNSNKTAQAVPSAPETLSLMCHDSNPQSRSDAPALCKDKCFDAECCWHPEGDFKCTGETQKQCPPYQVECNVWKDQLLGGAENHDGEMNVPPLPAGLQTNCAKTFGNDVNNDCKTGCAAAACCWNKYATHICTGDSVHNCLAYNEICEFLNDHLDKNGAYIQGGEPTAGNDDEDPDEISGGYDLGANGNPNSKDWPWPDAPDGLSVYCDPAEMEEISLHICEDKCDDAECCWKEGIDSCIDKYAPQACHDYTTSCAILNQLNLAPGNSHDITSQTPPPATAQSNDNTLPQAPSDLASKCSKDKLVGSDSGGTALIECERECLKASCCWQPNAATPCKDNNRCPAYGACDIFANLFEKPDDYDPNQATLAPMKVSQVPAAAPDINTSCSNDVLSTRVEGGKFIVECEKKCLMGACCWKENHPTHCPDAAECSAYQQPCGTNLVNALVALEGGHSNNGAGGPKPTNAPVRPPNTGTPVVENNVPEAGNNIAEICHPDVLKLTVSDGDFIIQCEKECLKAACCWKHGHATVCPDAPQCDEYVVPCGEHLAPVLAQMEGGSAQQNPVPSTPSQGTLPSAPDDMSVRCSLANLNSNPDGRGDCLKTCEPAQCCFLSTDGCSANPICEEYKLCENLRGSSPIGSGSNGGNAPPSPPGNLSTICSASELLDLSGLEKCRVACEAADCCWLSDADSQTCTTSVECRTYEKECEVMKNMINESMGSSNGNGVNSGATDTSSVQSACDTNTDFYLRSRCEQACRPGKCCLDGTTCQAGIDCVDYTYCNVLQRRWLRPAY